jgi:hypothetical protein
MRKFNRAVFVNCKWLTVCAARKALFSLLIAHLINRSRSPTTNAHCRQALCTTTHVQTECISSWLNKWPFDWFFRQLNDWTRGAWLTRQTFWLYSLIALAKQQILWSTNSLTDINRRTGWQINRTTGWLAERPFEYRVLVRNCHASRDGMSHLG